MADLQTTPSYRQVHKKSRQLANVEWMLTSIIEKQKNASEISNSRRENNSIIPRQGDQSLLNWRYGLMLSDKQLISETVYLTRKNHPHHWKVYPTLPLHKNSREITLLGVPSTLYRIV